MYAVVVVAYNRPNETRRLIDSILASDFCGDPVDLILSVDKGPRQEEVISACEKIGWPHGEYRIIKRPEKMGLRPHILSCGELTKEYDGIILLEDDLLVSPLFYRFAKGAMEFYRDDDRVAQISLYAYAVNEFVSRPFSPAKNELDVYAMQVTQSWGECWTKSMWEHFARSEFYGASVCPSRKDLPQNVNKWKENSWKKNFTNYIVSEKKYVIYPYTSLTTNYTISGEHSREEVADYHVVLQEGDPSFAFGALDHCVKYDAFFERNDLDLRALQLPDDARVCIDLYGTKSDFSDCDYILSTNALPFQTLREIALTLKPHEANLSRTQEGKGILLYDAKRPAKKPSVDPMVSIRYDVGPLRWRRSLMHGRRMGFLALQKRIKQFFKVKK